MTQEQFETQFELLSDEEAIRFVENAEKESSEYQIKLKNCMKASLVLFQVSQSEEDMTNWHIYAEKYLLGMNEENKEIPKEE